VELTTLVGIYVSCHFRMFAELICRVQNKKLNFASVSTRLREIADFKICQIVDVIREFRAKEDAGKSQYGAYDTTFVQHRRLPDALLVQALAFFMHEDLIWQKYK
jgi:hypothetical protein